MQGHQKDPQAKDGRPPPLVRSEAVGSPLVIRISDRALVQTPQKTPQKQLKSPLKPEQKRTAHRKPPTVPDLHSLVSPPHVLTHSQGQRTLNPSWEEKIRLASQQTMRQLTPTLLRPPSNTAQPNIRKAGYCHMCFGTWRKVWKNRYFVLHPETQTLSYTKGWDTPATKTPREISLKDAHVSMVERYRKYGYCWMIENADKRYYLCAFTKQDQYDWVQSIKAMFAPTTEGKKPIPTIERKSSLEQAWEAWEADQAELEKQRQWRLWMLEINQDDFEGRERREVVLTQGQNLLTPTKIEPLFKIGGTGHRPKEQQSKEDKKDDPTKKDDGRKKEDGKDTEVVWSEEQAALMTSSLDRGQLVWLHVRREDAGAGANQPRVLLLDIVGKKVTKDNMLTTFENFSPPGTKDHFEATAKQFEDAEILRHGKWLTQTVASGGSCLFFALLCRHLRRPEDFAHRASLGTTLFWGSSGDRDAALLSVQRLSQWLRSHNVMGDAVELECAQGACPTYDGAYRACFGLSRVSASSKATSTSTTTTSSSTSPCADPTAGSRPPVPVSFFAQGKPRTLEQTKDAISTALEQGLPILFSLNKRREFDYFIETRPHAFDAKAYWERWKHPFDEMRTHPCCTELFKRAIPAWMHADQMRYDDLTSQLTDKFKSFALLVLVRLVQQPPDLVKPLVFGDVLLCWMPPADKSHQFIVAHIGRLREWLEASQLLQSYSVDLAAKAPSELLSYERMYQKLFFCLPELGVSHLTMTPKSPCSEDSKTQPSPSISHLVSQIKGKFEFSKASDDADVSAGESEDSASDEDVPKEEQPHDANRRGYRDQAEKKWAEAHLAKVCENQRDESITDPGEAMFLIISRCVEAVEERHQARFMELVENRVFDRWFAAHMHLWHPEIEDAASRSLVQPRGSSEDATTRSSLAEF